MAVPPTGERGEAAAGPKPAPRGGEGTGDRRLPAIPGARCRSPSPIKKTVVLSSPPADPEKVFDLPNLKIC